MVAENLLSTRLHCRPGFYCFLTSVNRGCLREKGNASSMRRKHSQGNCETAVRKKKLSCAAEHGILLL